MPAFVKRAVVSFERIESVTSHPEWKLKLECDHFVKRRTKKGEEPKIKVANCMACGTKVKP